MPGVFLVSFVVNQIRIKVNLKDIYIYYLNNEIKPKIVSTSDFFSHSLILLERQLSSYCGMLKTSDDQTNIDKYRIATNITEYHIISKLIKIKLP